MRILVVDDDILIRKWLTMLLGQLPGENVTVAIAENGVKALKKIEGGFMPDLLITDIKMPQMDGLELCQRVKQRYPQVPVVILSAYEEFSFVRRALQLGALDYILKVDMRLDDISAVIEKAKQEQSRSASIDNARFRYAEGNYRLLEAYLKSDKTDDDAFLQRLDGGLTMDKLKLMMMRLDRSIDSELEDLPRRTGPVNAVWIPYRDTVYIALMRIDVAGQEQQKEAVYCYLEDLRRIDSFTIQAWATVLNCDETGLNDAIETCRSVLEFKYYYGLENFGQVPYHESGERSPTAMMPTYKKFFEAADRYQVEEAADLLRRCLDALHRTCCHPADVEKHLSLMCHKLLADTAVIGVGAEGFNRALMQIQTISKADTSQSRRQALEEFISQYVLMLSSVKKKRSKAVTQALAYIDAHYAEKITLDQVAGCAFMNSTYMSELFKKEMGVTLNDYINNLRIIHACEYLRSSNLSIGQVAERCGFTDQNYFAKVFKKILAKTPSQYRNSFSS